MTYRSQAVGSVFLGTPLAFAICAFYAQFGPSEPATNYIVAIFLLLPVWSAVLIWGLKRQDPRTTWTGLAVALALAVALSALVGHLIGN